MRIQAERSHGGALHLRGRVRIEIRYPLRQSGQRRGGAGISVFESPFKGKGSSSTVPVSLRGLMGDALK